MRGRREGGGRGERGDREVEKKREERVLSAHIVLPTTTELLGPAHTPLLSGKSLFSRISRASVPSSIRSNLVRTPMVRTPACGERKVWSECGVW